MNLLTELITEVIANNGGVVTSNPSYYKLLFQLNKQLGNKVLMTGCLKHLTLSSNRVKTLSRDALAGYLETNELKIPFELTRESIKKKVSINERPKVLSDVISAKEIKEIQATHKKKTILEKVNKQAKSEGKSVTQLLAQRIDKHMKVK